MSKSFRTRKRGTPQQVGQKFPVMEKKKLPSKISLPQPKRKVELVKEMDWEGRPLSVFTIDGKEVEVYAPGHTWEGYMREWEVIWDGAHDFMGTKRDLIRRYPELRGQI